MSLALDIVILKDVLKDFNCLSGLRIGIFDEAGKELAAYPEECCQFCSQLKKNKIASGICDASDQKAFHAVRASGKLNIYQCDFGLTEVVYPILDESKLAGYIMIGQMISGLTGAQTVSMRCAPYFSDKQQMDMLIDTVTRLDDDRIRACASVMRICAIYLSLTKKVRRMRTKKSQEFREYIQMHFREPITTASVGQKLGLGKTAVCHLAKQEFNTSLLNYVNHLRIEEIKRLLENTDLSLKEIAAVMGFGDQNYLSRLFKCKTNMTPTQYRSRNRL